jgi:hypothetical protein
VDGVIAREDPSLFTALAALAADARLVFFAGLPGTGKSLLIHQLAHLAHARGRRIHLLQWDVARPAFEASAAGAAYPLEGGVTHGVIRLAVGRWARAAVGRWHAAHPGFDEVLIGETPFIGHRLIELARPATDEAEKALAGAWTRFVIPVPSRALRQHLEAERARRAREPRHPREREDAPPSVLADLWRELAGADIPYDPAIYQRTYERLLVRRHAVALPLEKRLPTAGMSAYELAMPTTDLLPTADEITGAIRDVEAEYRDPAALQRALESWHRAPRAPRQR